MNVHCRNCNHYFITWDPERPYGCRAMGFKSRQMPFLTVRRTTPGMDCQRFEPRPSSPSQRPSR